MYDILFKFKELISEDYAQAKKIVTDYPVLGQALLKCCKVFDSMNNPAAQNEEMQLHEGSTANQNSAMEIEDDPTAVNEEILSKILSLTPEQIESLPEDEKQKVLKIIQAQMQNLTAQN